MQKQGTKQVTIGYRVRDGEGIYRFIWKQDARKAVPVHAPEGFDPRAAGRELALEDKQRFKEQIARWRDIQQSLKDRSLSREDELALANLIETWLGELAESAG